VCDHIHTSFNRTNEAPDKHCKGMLSYWWCGGGGEDSSTTDAYNLYHRLDYTFAVQTFLYRGVTQHCLENLEIHGTENLAERSKSFATERKG
jgi:hypothetical protein